MDVPTSIRWRASDGTEIRCIPDWSQVTVIKGKNPCSHNTLLCYWIKVETMHLSFVKRWDITGSSCVFSYTGMPPSPNVGLRLAHRLRRCANLKPTLGPRLVFSRDGGTHHTPHVIQCLLCGPATMTMRRRNPIEICLIISHPWQSKGNCIENCHDTISVKGILHAHMNAFRCNFALHNTNHKTETCV